MSDAELKAKLKLIRKRRGYRGIITWLTFLFSSVYGMWLTVAMFGLGRIGLMQAAFAFLIVGGIAVVFYDFRATKSDCYKYSALCPHCGVCLVRNHLLRRVPSALKTGQCPNCDERLFEPDELMR